MSFSLFIKELQGKRVEGKLLQNAFISLLIGIAVLIVLYYLSFSSIDGFLSDYGFSLLFLALSFALIIPLVGHVGSYNEMPCMAGMMIGMTSGMIAGFLPGFYVAMTNGMFIGGFFGVVLGIIFGVWNGKCCGIMGVMEGAMAGFMGGLMGAMTAFMLFNDHVKLAGLLVFIICAGIVAGLHYLVYKEMREASGKNGMSLLSTSVLSFVLIIISTLLVVFGPRSSLFT